MAYYYIKNGGTATGDAGRSVTKRTGSFATMGVTAYYDSIYDVFTGAVPTTTPNAVDTIMVSSSHNKVYVGANTLLGITDGSTLYSVDDSNADTYLKGASEEGAASFLLALAHLNSSNLRMFSEGINYHSNNGVFNLAYGPNQTITLKDCSIGFVVDNSYVSLSHDGSVIILIDVTFDALTTSYFVISRSRLLWNGGSLGGATATLLKSAASNGPGATVKNVDLTGLTKEVTDVLASTANDLAIIEIYNVLLSSGVLVDATISAQARNISVIGRSIGYGVATDTYHHFVERYFVGYIEENLSIYRDLGATYDGITPFSAKMVGSSYATLGKPLTYTLVSNYIDTSKYSGTITFTVHFAVDGETTVLNSDEFWMEVEYKDGADNALGRAAGTKALPLVDGTAPTTETGLWTIGATNKQMSISKSIAIGSNTGDIVTGIVEVSVYLAIPNQTVYVCPKIELS